MRYIVHFLFIVLSTVVYGQQDPYIDSLKRELAKSPSDSIRVMLLSTLADEIADEKEWMKYNAEALALAEKYSNVSDKALRKHYLRYQANAKANLGYYNDSHGKVQQALDLYFEALKLFDACGYDEGKGSALGNIGIILSDRGDYKEAEDIIRQSIDLKKKYAPEDLAVNYINLGAVYEGMGKRKESLRYYEMAVEAATKAEDYINLGTAFNNIGTIHYRNEEYREAIGYLKEAVKNYQLGDDASGYAWAMTNIGENYFNLDMLDSAAYYSQIAEEYALELGYPQLIANVSGNLFKVYYRQERWEEALRQQIRHTKMTDSILNVDVQKSALRQKLEYDHELETNLLNVKREEDQKRFTQAMLFSAAGLLMLIVFSVLIYRRLRIARKQKQLIEEANKEIVDSINYAKRLQDAILPTEAMVKRMFTDAFVLYQPKDIVAGDFYWMHSSDDELFIAVADCTGHGVPGALVSVVCANALDRSVNEFGLRDTGAILDKVRELVVVTFEKSNQEVKDGMDIALCRYDKSTQQLSYSGAHNPLWIKRSNGEMEVVKADRQPIGKFDNAQPFTAHTLQLNDGDWVYLFSDGYADQFGGEGGKKFKSGSLKKCLEQLHQSNGDQQLESLINTFNAWKGNLEQLDDVCILGWCV